MTNNKSDRTFHNRNHIKSPFTVPVNVRRLSYDALTDQNADSYFRSAHMDKHCLKLKGAVLKSERSSSNKKMNHNLHLRLSKIRNSAGAEDHLEHGLTVQ